MTQIAPTASAGRLAHAPRARRFGPLALLDWLVRKDAAYREARRFDRLNDHARRDIGLPPRPQGPAALAEWRIGR